MLHRARREQRRKGRIAAEADHRVGPVLAVERLGLAAARAITDAHALSQPIGPPPSRPAGRMCTGTSSNSAGEARAALVGDQQHAMAALLQLRGERMGRDHVPAGASGGQNEIHAVTLSPLHFTT